MCCVVFLSTQFITDIVQCLYFTVQKSAEVQITGWEEPEERPRSPGPLPKRVLKVLHALEVFWAVSKFNQLPFPSHHYFFVSHFFSSSTPLCWLEGSSKLASVEFLGVGCTDPCICCLAVNFRNVLFPLPIVIAYTFLVWFLQHDVNTEKCITIWLPYNRMLEFANCFWAIEWPSWWYLLFC